MAAPNLHDCPASETPQQSTVRFTVAGATPLSAGFPLISRMSLRLMSLFRTAGAFSAPSRPWCLEEEGSR
jgi:hypothetical protein